MAVQRTHRARRGVSGRRRLRRGGGLDSRRRSLKRERRTTRQQYQRKQQASGLVAKCERTAFAEWWHGVTLGRSTGGQDKGVVGLKSDPRQHRPAQPGPIAAAERRRGSRVAS